jgi:electron transport complex protein RnfE
MAQTNSPKLLAVFKNGLIKENPALVLLLGLCPALAITTSAFNGVGMGLAATFVLLGSNIFVSLLGPSIPHNVRVPVFIVVIATFTTIVDLFIQAYSPALSESLGLFIPLIVVNCIVLGRAEMFASKNRLSPAVADALGMGLGFALALGVFGSVREILGEGTWFGIRLFGKGYEPFLMAIMPAGGFLTMGLTIAILNKVKARGKTAQKTAD